MIILPSHLFNQYRSFCTLSGVADATLADHVKWIRYFLDFCEKYQVTGDETERIRLFLEKLRQKGQSGDKRQQAARAVTLYFALIRTGGGGPKHPERTSSAAASRQLLAETARSSRPSQYNVAGYQEKSDSLEWDEVMEKLADEIKARHYSRKTLQRRSLPPSVSVQFFFALEKSPKALSKARPVPTATEMV